MENILILGLTCIVASVSHVFFFFAVFPKLIEKPSNVSVVAGKTFELHCQAQGHPEPVLSWQKDGGTSFPAADDRRMDFLPTSKVYVIVIRDAKPGDTGKYTCSAKNEAGFVNATAFVTVLGKRTPINHSSAEERIICDDHLAY